MNVLTLSHLFPPQGGTFVLEQIKALRECGVQSQVIAPTPWPPPFLRSLPRLQPYFKVPYHDEVQGFQVEHPRFGCLPRSRMFYLQGISIYLAVRTLMRHLLRTHAPDLIHAHTIMPDGFAAVLLGREFNLPVVCTIHGSDINLYPFRNRATLLATKWALRNVAQLVAVSMDLQTKILKLSSGVAVNVVNNGADPQVFKPLTKTEARRVLGLSISSFIILFVGNLVPVKGLQFLLQAMADLPQGDIRLYAVGNGELRESLLLRARLLGIQDRFESIGKCPHPLVATWLSAADCLVLPSISEGLPTILPEAMLCRTPIIASRVGGIPEIVEDGITGLLIPPKDSKALRDAIAKIISNPGLGLQLAAEAEKIARHKLTWGQNARSLMKVYERAMGSVSKSHAQSVLSSSTPVRHEP